MYGQFIAESSSLTTFAQPRLVRVARNEHSIALGRPAGGHGPYGLATICRSDTSRSGAPNEPVPPASVRLWPASESDRFYIAPDHPAAADLAPANRRYFPDESLAHAAGFNAQLFQTTKSPQRTLLYLTGLTLGPFSLTWSKAKSVTTFMTTHWRALCEPRRCRSSPSGKANPFSP